jgi:putative membrane protein
MRLAQLALRSLRRTRLTRAALVVLALVPLLYGAVYLWAFWDPYGNLNRIPAALVVDDRTATSADGLSLHAGKDLADQLVDRQVFAWQRTSAATAERELRDGTVQIVLRIPAGFSAALATGPDPKATPQPGQLQVTTDDANNYLAGLLARGAFTEIRAAAADSAASRYFNQMLIGFSDLKAQTTQAADGAEQLADGTGDAKNGADQAAAGADRARAGAGTLANGLDTATAGAERLSAGLTALDAGAAQLADGTAQAAAGGQLLATKVDAVTGRIEPVLRDNATTIQQAATAIATGADTLATQVDSLTQLARTGVDQTTAVRSDLDALATAHPELRNDPAWQKARAAADAAVRVATAVRDKVDATDLAALKTDMRRVADLARQVAAAAPHLADDVAAARGQVDALAAGLHQLASGADRLHQGTSDASAGAKSLQGGLFRLASGARQLDDGLAQLSDGTHQLASGLSTLDGGATKLANGLSDGAQKIPGYDANDRAHRADVLADPVDLQRAAEHAAATYGVGFAPYFMALALWVGAMITYMLLKPVQRRQVMAGGAPARVALAGWGPGAVVGVAQALVLFLVIRFALGVVPVHPWATAGYLVLASVAFTALVQWLGARLGPAGRLVALALLMLQLTSSGGTYPVQTQPAFFRALHPWLPMTYVVDGLRHLIDGGAAVWSVRGAVILACFAVLGFTLTTVAVWRARRLTPAKLHPDLVM